MDDSFLHFMRDYIWLPLTTLLGWLVMRSIGHRNDLDAYKLHVSEKYSTKEDSTKLEERIDAGFDKLDRKLDLVFSKIDLKQDKP